MSFFPRQPRVLNIWDAHCDGKVPEGAVYCGRSRPRLGLRASRYCSPFQIGRDGDRDECCDRFEAEILPDLDVEELRGKDLVCYCKPKRCHCDPILIKANRPKVVRT